MFICALLAFGWSSAQVADIDRTVDAIEQSLDLNLQFSNLPDCELSADAEVQTELTELEIIEASLENGTAPTPSPFPTYYYLGSDQICVRPNTTFMGYETCKCPSAHPNCGFEGSEMEPTSYYCFKAMPQEQTGPEYWAQGLILSDDESNRSHGPRVFVGIPRSETAAEEEAADAEDAAASVEDAAADAAEPAAEAAEPAK